MDSSLKKYGWFEWLSHSEYSFLVGVGRPECLVDRSHGLGYSGIALCDFDGVYGLVKGFKRAEKVPSAFRFFYGAELHLFPDHDLPVLQQKTLVLIATSHRGYRNLCCLLSACRREETGKKNPFLSLEKWLEFDLTDLVAVVPMRGFLRSLIQERSTLNMNLILPSLIEHFRGQFYFALGSFDTRYEDWLFAEALSIAKLLGCRMLLSSDSFFISEDDKFQSDITQAIRVNRRLEDCCGFLFPNAERHLRGLDLIERKFSKLSIWTECLRNSRILADSIDFSFSELRYEYPKEMIPQGFGAHEYLCSLVSSCLNQKYESIKFEKVKDQCDRELALIEQLGFADYFLTVWDIVSWARSQGILCQGRGSAANSAVCYVLGITSVDPAVFELLFERFLSAERGDPPDIDVDFEHERREEVIQYIYQRYGRHRAAMVANIISFRRKGAVRAAGLALGVSRPVVDYVAKQLSTVRYRSTPLREIFSSVLPSCPTKKVDQHTLGLWLDCSDRLIGVPRHLGIHSGGFVITEKSLNDLSQLSQLLCVEEQLSSGLRMILRTLVFLK